MFVKILNMKKIVFLLSPILILVLLLGFSSTSLNHPTNPVKKKGTIDLKSASSQLNVLLNIIGNTIDTSNYKLQYAEVSLLCENKIDYSKVKIASNSKKNSRKFEKYKIKIVPNLNNQSHFDFNQIKFLSEIEDEIQNSKDIYADEKSFEMLVYFSITKLPDGSIYLKRKGIKNYASNKKDDCNIIKLIIENKSYNKKSNLAFNLH
jgi:uncharacterized membrane protein